MNKITITPLGTISPYCKNNMNCPGFLIEYNNQRILLDCGNGITSLLNFPNDLINLNVFITHYHVDHYGDLGTIQYASYCYHNLGLLDEKIKIYLPEGNNKKEITSRKETYSDYYNINDNETYHIADLKIEFKNNKSHTIESYMIRIQNKDFKIIYTSDIGTTNIEDVVEYCKNADLIICESSYLKRHNAQSKTHLTASLASKIAMLANAKQLLLTHFWPEEDKSLYLEEAKENFENTDVAEEGKKLILKK